MKSGDEILAMQDENSNNSYLQISEFFQISYRSFHLITLCALRTPIKE